VASNFSFHHLSGPGSGWKDFPFSFPILGLPLIFALTAAAAVLVSPVRLNIWKTSLATAEQLLPLVGTLTCVGILVQVMTLTGVRGLISVSIVTLPAAVVIASLFLTLPLSEAVLMWEQPRFWECPWFFFSTPEDWTR